MKKDEDAYTGVNGTDQSYAGNGLQNQTAADIAGSYYRTVRISFNGNGGAVSPQSIEGYLDMKINSLPEAEREGYHFEGWFTDRVGGTRLEAGNEAAQLTYYAHWRPYIYTLRIYPLTGNSETGEARDDIIEIKLEFAEFYQLSENLFTNEGRFLVGWNTRSDGKGKMYEPNARVSGLADQDGSTVNLYAIWGDPEDYVTLTFNTQGGSDIPSMRFKKGERTQYLPHPTREGYQFDFWSYNPDGTSRLGESSYVEMTKDTTLYAQWLIYLTATFKPCVEGLSETTVQTTSKTPLRSLPRYPQQKDFRTLIGWFTEAEGGIQVKEGETYLTQDETFYAHWGWKPQFDTMGGKLKEEPNIPYVEGSSLYILETLPEATRDGYEFAGWYWEYTENDAKKEEKIEDSKILDLSKGTRIVAHWTPWRKINLTLDLAGGILNGKKEKISLKSYIEKSVGDLPIPERDGYVFQGWYDDEGQLCSPNRVFYKDMTLTARWAEEVYVTFKDGNTIVERFAVARNGTIPSLPGANKKQGENPQILEGWYADPEYKGEMLTASTPITEDTVFYAKWRDLNTTGSVGGISYTYGIEWNSASNENVDNVGDSLVFHPTDYRDQTAALHVHFQTNKESQEGSIPAGAVKIKIPKHVWKNWSGEWVGTCNVDQSLTASDAPDGNQYFSYKEDDTGNYYILYNSKSIPGGAGMDATFSYTVSPASVPGGGIDAAGNYVVSDDIKFYKETFPVEILVEPEDGTESSRFEKDLSIEMHTRVRTFASKEFSKIQYSYIWQDKWGPKPADADDYFYIEWKLKETVESTTNQPFTFTWSEENTVHDGTVVGIMNQQTAVDNPSGYQAYYDKQRVVVKYPLTMLNDAVDGKLNIHNEAIVTEDWQSGYQTSHRVSANYTVEVPTGGGPAGFEKISFNTQNNTHPHEPAQKPGGQEDILDDEQEVPLEWRISYGGGPETEAVWDDASDTYTAASRTICITDGTENNLMYSSGSAENKYAWKPSTDNIMLSDDDYRLVSVRVGVTEYDAERLTDKTWTGKKEHANKADYEGVDIYVRYKNSNELILFRHAECGEVVSLPENARGIRILHNSSFYWTEIRADLTVNLKPSDTINRLLREDVRMDTTSIIKNWARCQVYAENAVEPYANMTDYNESGSAIREVWELDVSDTYQYLCKSAANQANTLTVDVKHGIQDNPMCLTGWLYNNSNRTKRLQTGIFYDLLPQGTTVDPSTVYGIWFQGNHWSTPGSPGKPANNYYTKLNVKERLPKSAYDVEFVDNWEGSKRTMMIIRFTMPEGVRANGVHMYYLLRTTYENIMENGTTQENDAAFVNTSTLNGLPDGTGAALNNLHAKEYFKKLDEQYSGTICYFEDSTHYAPVDVSTWGFDKQVKAETGASYGQSDTSLLNNLYTYRLVYSQGSGTKTKNIVFFDVLENGFYEKKEDVPGGRELLPSQWKGTFVDINVESVRKNRMDEANPQTACNPVIYYSTKPRENFADVRPELKDTEVWTTTMPDDPSQVTAIAVDCSTCINETPFELTGKVDALEIYITMRAPQEVKEGEDITRNRAAVYMTHVSSENKETSVMMDAGASVTLKDVDPELHKTSDPGSGTKEAPAPVYKDDPLTYTLSVTNTGKEAPLKNIVVEDTIPGGLSVQNNGIRVRFDDDKTSMLVSESPRVDLTRDGQNLTFTIRSLNAGETAYIEITGTVTADAETVLENQAHITSVNDVHKDLDSEKTYHKVIPIGFNIFKVGAGRRPIKGAKLELWKKAEGADPDEPLDKIKDTCKEV